MNHQDLERELPWFMNGTLDAETAARIERELPGCDGCADELAEIRTMRDSLREQDASASDAPSALAYDVFRRIGASATPAEQPQPSNVRRLPMRTIGGLGLATAAGLAIFVGSVHHNGPSAENSNVSYFSAPSGPHYGEDVPAAAPPAAANAPVVTDKVAAMDGASMRSAAGAGAIAPAEHALKVPAAMVQEAQAARARKLARTGDIGLIVNDVAIALTKIDRLANDQFGTVTALEDNSPAVAGETHTASVTLSVPSDRFESSLDAIAGMGGVTSRNVRTEDLTDSMVDTEARLRNLRHEEADLVKIMDRQGKVEDILDVEQQLATTRESIEQLDAQDKAMEGRVSYSTIVISLTDEKHVTVAAPGPASEIGLAWTHALQSVGHFTIGIISNALFLLAYAPYLLILGAICWFAYRKLRGAVR